MKLLRKYSLQSKMIIFIVALVLFQIGIMGLVSSNLVDTILEDQLGKRVLDVSQTIATMPEVAKLLAQQDPDGELQVLAEAIRLKTGAQFVVIGDRQERRYSHPDTEKIGHTMVGGDNDQALIVKMYDPLGHYVYFESHGGFSNESGRKRNTTQATSSRARS